MSTELREKILAHLEKRPYWEILPTRRQRLEVKMDWTFTLNRLRSPLTHGESTGDLAADYALMTTYSPSAVERTQNYIHQLQTKIAANVNQEVLVAYRGYDLDQVGYGRHIMYPYTSWKLAQIQERSLKAVVDPRFNIMYLVIVTKGLVRASNSLSDAFYGKSLQFLSDDLVIPDQSQLCAVGTAEMASWRKNEPENEHRYQKMSALLSQSLTKQAS